jgi:hypothetical protein
LRLHPPPAYYIGIRLNTLKSTQCLMSSVRVPPKLLDDLHKAAPPGISLPRLIELLLEEAGGPEQMHARLARETRRAVFKTQLAKLRRARHPSVVLEEGHQEGLAWGATGWVQALESEGLRVHDPVNRTITLAWGRPQPSAEQRKRFTMKRVSLG